MKKIALSLLLCLLLKFALPCSTFFINHNGQMVFGRNYDWVAGTGMVCTNLRGLQKTSFKAADGGTINWTSRYGSITFNQYGKEFPTGGMNEKGLVVELMWLDETVYPKADARPAIGVLQWIQYQLDNCATIEDVIASDKLLRITATTTPLHYLIADANGNGATIEFLEGRMVVHKGRDLSFPVLTNSVYEQSAQYAAAAIKNNENIQGSGSLERFARACSMIDQYQSGKTKASLVDHSFNILNAVSQGSHTKWSLVYDITNRRIFFRTHDASQIKSVSFSGFDLSCQQTPLCLDINTATAGEVTQSFKTLTPELNRQLLSTSANLSKSEVNISKTMQEEAAKYPFLIKCN